jgi:plasmid maintenance system antidote protein VapI
MKNHSTWLQRRMESPTFRRAIAREHFIEEFLGRIEEEMRRSNVTRIELADRMGCRPSNVTRILKRTTNLTAESMVDLAEALGLRLLPLVKPAVHSAGRQCEIVPFPIVEHWGHTDAGWSACDQEEAAYGH